MWGRRSSRGRVGDGHPRSPTKRDWVSTWGCRDVARPSEKMPQVGWQLPSVPWPRAPACWLRPLSSRGSSADSPASPAPHPSQEDAGLESLME